MRTLIVGGAGYVGSHAVKRLMSAGHSVSVLDNLSRGHRDAVLCDDFIEADLLDPPSLDEAFRGRQFDVVMHFAAFCYVGESVERPLDYYRNNFTGMLNLLATMSAHSVKRLVFSSSCSTYGNPVEVPIRETHSQNPINPYGASKLFAEIALSDLARASGLASVSLRYFNAAGCDVEGQLGERHDPETHLIPLALREALRVRRGGDPGETRLVIHGDDYPTPDGTCIRDYVHVDDLGAAHLLAAERLVDGTFTGAQAFNLGADKGSSVLQVIDACRKVTETPFQYRIGPRRLGDPPILIADSDAARSGLGWQPQHQDLATIVATAWNWYSRNGAHFASISV